MTALAQTAQLCVTTPTVQTPPATTQLYATPQAQQTLTQLVTTQQQTRPTQSYATTQTQQTPLATTQ